MTKQTVRVNCMITSFCYMMNMKNENSRPLKLLHLPLDSMDDTFLRFYVDIITQTCKCVTEFCHRHREELDFLDSKILIFKETTESSHSNLNYSSTLKQFNIFKKFLAIYRWTKSKTSRHLSVYVRTISTFINYSFYEIIKSSIT